MLLRHRLRAPVMALKIRTLFLYVLLSIFFFATVYHLRLPTVDHLRRRFNPQLCIPNSRLRPYVDINQIINEKSLQQDATTTAGGEPPYDEDTDIIMEETTSPVQFDAGGTIQFKPQISVHNPSMPIEVEGTVLYNQTDDVYSITKATDWRKHSISSVSILFPAWEALVIVSSGDGDDKKNTSYFCLFDTNEVSQARFSGTMLFPDRRMFTCQLPTRVRRRQPFRQPLLTQTPDQDRMKYDPLLSSSPELLRWNFIVYDVIETENDVVLLAKGINNRQGTNRSPTEFKCLFGDDSVNGVTTSVTSSLQEVFRCQRPDLTAFTQNPVSVSLVILQTNQVVPSVAYYTPRRMISNPGTKSLLCACTMVYNVAKFLKEWVIYHSRIGVDKFILYDNGSDDNLAQIITSLKSSGYNIEARFWLWPKTQEAGFSHAALFAKDFCRWMMYIDVDEFVYSPLWKSSHPSNSLLPSLLPSGHYYGQLVIGCYEFGPSNQKKHPLTGVTQGYNCRKETENRHKSIVRLDALHDSLVNVVHHFKLKDGFKTKKVGLDRVVVNHYKFQAWPEFKAKFRRRVSAYVVDWTQSVNLKSNDRAPGLGNLAVEPQGWEARFCEVYDNRVKTLTRRWFGRRNGRSGFRMVWQN